MLEKFFAANRERWSETTEDLYRYYLGHMLSAIGSQPTTEDLRRWLNQPRWGPSSRYQATVAAKHFFRWLVGQANSPAEALRRPRRIAAVQRTMRAAEVRQLIAACDTSTPKGIRDLAIILLLVDAGLRATECISVQAQHVDLEEMTLRVVTKGSRVQAKMFSAYTAAQLREWLNVRCRIARTAVPQLFVGIGGLHPGQQMSSSGLRIVLWKLGLRAGVPGVTPHAFRRAFACLKIKAGGSTREAQILGGWSKVELVERYTLAYEVGRDDVERHSPVNYLMGIQYHANG